MRNALIFPWLLAAAVVALTAQTPAPHPAPPASGNPLRHLEYSFSAHEEGMSGYSYNGINSGGAGVGTDQVSDGADGTMSIDVLSLSGDGALNVRILESVKDEARPRQSYTCEVYGNTSVLCPDGPAPSEAEYVLISYLGRQFVDGAPWDPQNHWRRTYQLGGGSVTEDFALADTGDGKHVTITEVRKTQLHNIGFASQSELVSITYDRSMEVPDKINAVADSSSEGGTDHSTFDYTLLSDSFAKP